MKKSSLFISAVLTSFVLVILVGAVSAYRTYAEGLSRQTEAAQVQPISQKIATPTETIQSVLETYLTPQQGAELAAMYLGRWDLYSVEGDFLYGLDVYKVTFSNGDLAYVSTDGQILRIVPAEVQYVQSNNSQPQASSSEHEGNDDD